MSPRLATGVRPVSRQVARRFVLGCQGLWPGRRTGGIDGTRAALRTAGLVQVDPINVVARSHDLALHGRVADYRPEYLDRLMYADRKFFDYGGTVFVLPMEELPYWRVHMARRTEDKRWRTFSEDQAGLLDDVRQRLRECGPLGNRDFAGSTKASSFRSSKKTADALYYLWLTGELMTHGRRGFERLYDFRDRVAPPAFRHSASVAEAEEFFASKALDVTGIASARSWAHRFSRLSHRPIGREEARGRLTALVEQGVAAPVVVESIGAELFVLADRMPLLAELVDGAVPPSWRPIGPDTVAEATLLAPLEFVSARGRAMEIFDFEYVWEVYKPAERRRWGYYTTPVLWGDDLVARLDPKLDRERQLLLVRGLWLEDPAIADDVEFLDALAAAIRRLADFTGAVDVDLGAVAPISLRNALQRGVRH